MKIVWTKLAIADLNHVYDFIAQENISAAGRVINRIHEATQSLVYYPDLGRPGRVKGTQELFISSTPFALVYRVKQDRIEILSVLHTSRKWPDSFN